MYFITNKRNINIWTNDIKKAKYKLQDNILIFTVKYNTFTKLDKNWVSWVCNENVFYKYDKLKKWDIFKSYSGNRYEFLSYENDYYTEKITDPLTCEIIKECKEPLSEHKGHGSAKFKKTDK